MSEGILRRLGMTNNGFDSVVVFLSRICMGGWVSGLTAHEIFVAREPLRRAQNVQTNYRIWLGAARSLATRDLKGLEHCMDMYACAWSTPKRPRRRTLVIARVLRVRVGGRLYN